MPDPGTSQEQGVQYDFVPEDLPGSLFRTARAVLLSPRDFYKKMKTEGGFRNPTLFLACCILIHALFIGLLARDEVVIIQGLMYGIAMPFVTAGLLFLFITKFFKESGTYQAAFRVMAYASAVNLATWIPVARLVLEFYRLYLIAWGLTYAFSTRISRAVLAIVLTMITYLFLGPFVFQVLGIQI